MKQRIPFTPAVSTLDKIFPRLKPEQWERILPYGKRRPIQRDEILFQQGDKIPSFYVVLSGELEVLRIASHADTLVTTLGPGQFTGEINLISGRRTLVRLRALQEGEVIEVDRERLLALVQNDNELGEILLSAFILRRLNLVASGFGDVVLLGSAYSAGTLRIKEFLTRNGNPYTYIDLEGDADVQTLLYRFQVKPEDVPVVICQGD